MWKWNTGYVDYSIMMRKLCHNDKYKRTKYNCPKTKCILTWNTFFSHMKAALWNLLQNNIHPFLLIFCFESSSVLLDATEWGPNFFTFIVITLRHGDSHKSTIFSWFNRSAVSNVSQLHFMFIFFQYRASPLAPLACTLPYSRPLSADEAIASNVTSDGPVLCFKENN